MINNKYTLLILLVVGYLIFSANTGGIMIYILDEAKNAECAREMYASGDWVVPRFNGELRTDKPPLHYFFMGAAYSVFGVNPFAARFFSVVFGLLTVWLTYHMAARYLSKQAAFYSAVVLLASLHMAFQFHLSVPDPYLIFFITLSLYSFFRGYTEQSTRHMYLCYAAVGLGTLAKGPIAIALPGLIFLLFILYRRDLKWRSIVALRPFTGALVVLAIALPWYIAVHLATDGEWTRGFFIDHNANRFADTKEGHGGLFIYTPLVATLGLLPFGLFIIQAIRYGYRNRQHALLPFALTAVLAIIGFFSISSTKLPNYAVPAYPFLAILLGYYLSQLHTINLKKALLPIGLWFWVLLATAMPIGIYLALSNDPNMAHLNHLAFAFIALPVGAVLAVVLYYRRRLTTMVASLALSFMLTALVNFHYAYPAIYDTQNPVAVILPQLNPERPLGYYKIMNAAFVFNKQQLIPKTATTAELKAFFNANPTAYIITRKKYLDEISAEIPIDIVAQKRDIFETPTTVVLQLKQ